MRFIVELDEIQLLALMTITLTIGFFLGVLVERV